jgi:hypothetical protein
VTREKGDKELDPVAIDRRRFFEFALRLSKDGRLLRRIRERSGSSKTQVAKKAKIAVSKLTSYERPGPVRGNFWLFCHHLRSFNIDPRLIDDPDYLDQFLDPDKGDQMEGGKIRERDNRYEFGGEKDRRFRRWAHREKIEKMSDTERQKPLSRGKIRKWHKEFKKKSERKQNMYEIEEPLD